MKIELTKKQDRSGPETMGLTPISDYKPSVYLSDIEGLDGIKVGDKVTMEGVVKSVSHRSEDGKDDYSCEVELSNMERPGKDAGTKTGFKRTTIDRSEKEIEEALKQAENNDRSNPNGHK